MNKDLTISGLESYLNVTQLLIDKILCEAKMNNITNLSANKRLQKLSKYRDIIIKEIECRLDETFSEKN